MTGQLPTLVPSSNAVQAVTAALAATFGITDDSMAGDKNWVANKGLEVLTKAYPHLIGDVLDYAFTNHKVFGFSAHTTDQLIDAAIQARAAADVSQETPSPGLG